MTEKEYDCYLELEKKFKKIDKIIIEVLGKPCPDFSPKCAVCKGYLIYNNFKEKMFEEYTE